MRRIYYPFPLGAEGTFGQDAASYALGWPDPNASYNPSAPGTTFSTWNENMALVARAYSSPVTVIKTNFQISGLDDSNNYRETVWVPPAGLPMIVLPPVIRLSTVVMFGSPSVATDTSVFVAAGYKTGGVAPADYVSSVTLSQALLKPNATETGWSFDGTDWTWVPKGAGGNSSKPEFHMGLADGPPFNGSFTPSANPTSADQSVPSPGFWASIQQASLPSFYIFPFSDAFLLGGSADRFVVGMTNAGGGTYKMTALGEVYIPIIPLFDS